MVEELVVSEERPLLARRILEILTCGPKLQILKVLLEKGEVSAKDLSAAVGTKLSTVLSHLHDLVRAGLVEVRIVKSNGRTIKKYRLRARKLTLVINLNLFLHLEERLHDEELKELEDLAYRYIELKRASDGLPLAISVRDVANTLGTDLNTAIEVTDFINTHTERVVEYLSRYVVEVLRSKGTASLRDLAKELNVHYYWIVLVVQSLVSKGIVSVDERGHVKLTSTS